jgi:hypothetical protein
MMRALRCWWVAVIGFVPLLAACGGRDAGDEPVGSDSQRIYNGGAPPQTPEELGFAYVAAQRKDVANQLTYGTGVFFDNHHLLTAKHVVEGARTPGVVVVRMGSQVFHGTAFFPRVSSSPLDPHQLDIAVVRVDSAATINGNSQTYVRPLLNLNGDGVYASGITSVDCYGYGHGTQVNGVDQGLGQFRFATMPLTPRVDPFNLYDEDTPDYFWVEAQPPTDPQLARGDSGGPCLYSNPANPLTTAVVGIAKGVSAVPLGYPPRYGFVTALGWWGQFWVMLQARSIVSATGDFDADGALDTIAITVNNGLLNIETLFGNELFPGSSHGLVNFDSAGLLQAVLGGVTVPAPVLDDPPALVAAGDFNGNGTSDILSQFGGYTLYYDGVLGGLPIPHLAPFSPSAQYAELRSADFDGDGYDDLEGLMSNGYVDVYYGSPSGLGSVAQMNGVPTADGNDGKFLSLSGPGLITVVYPSTELNIYTNESDLRIEVFDGDVGGTFDNAVPGIQIDDGKKDVACYLLQDCSGPCTNVLVRSSEDFADADNAWKPLHETVAPGTRYKLRVTLGTCDGTDCTCDQNGQPPGPVGTLANQVFKVRANAQLGIDSSDWAFMGLDGAGDYTPARDLLAPIPDTTFDGDFQFPLWLGAEPETVYITDCDADYLLDGTRDPSDTSQEPGVAVGANDTVKFSLLWHDGNGAMHTEFPNTSVSAAAIEQESGEGLEFLQWYRDPSGNVECEQHAVDAQAKGGWWRWWWHGMAAVNNVQVTPTTGSASQTSTPYSFVFDRSGKGIPSPSSAMPIDDWRSDTQKVASTLPVDIGSDLTVSDDQVAALVLAPQGFSVLPVSGSERAWLKAMQHDKVTLCHEGAPITAAASAVGAHLAHGDDIARPHGMTLLLAQLLTAELNLKAASQLGEDLASAAIYGREETVGEIVTEAEAAVQNMDQMCTLDDAQLQRLAWLTQRLRAINAGDVRYVSTSVSKAVAKPTLLVPLGGGLSLSTSKQLPPPQLSSPYIGQ